MLHERPDHHVAGRTVQLGDAGILAKGLGLPVERLLTSVSPLSDINLCMDRLADGSAIRQVVIPGDST